MASPNTTFDEIFTTTIYNRRGRLADNLSNNNALLLKLKSNGNADPVPGGYQIVEELMYDDPGNYTRYSGYDTLDISQDQMLTAANFAWKQAAVAVTMSGLDELRNSGREAVIRLMAARIDAAEKGMINSMSTDIYSNGTASSGKQIGGLQSLVADAGTGTVGGINSSTYTWWKNQFYDFSANSVTAGPSTIQTARNTLYLNCVRGADKPDLIVADNTYYRYYWESLQAIQRLTDANSRMAAAGFRGLDFMGADVIPDGGLSGSAPSAHMYFLNTKTIFFRPHRDRNMVPLNPDRYATNQDARVRLIAWAGNMTVNNRRLNGVIVA